MPHIILETNEDIHVTKDFFQNLQSFLCHSIQANPEAFKIRHTVYNSHRYSVSTRHFFILTIRVLKGRASSVLNKALTDIQVMCLKFLEDNQLQDVSVTVEIQEISEWYSKSKI